MYYFSNYLKHISLFQADEHGYTNIYFGFDDNAQPDASGSEKIPQGKLCIDSESNFVLSHMSIKDNV